MKHCVHSIIPIYPLVSEQIDSDETKKNKLRTIHTQFSKSIRIIDNNREWSTISIISLFKCNIIAFQICDYIILTGLTDNKSGFYCNTSLQLEDIKKKWNRYFFFRNLRYKKTMESCATSYFSTWNNKTVYFSIFGIHSAITYQLLLSQRILSIFTNQF